MQVGVGKMAGLQGGEQKGKKGSGARGTALSRSVAAKGRKNRTVTTGC